MDIIEKYGLEGLVIGALTFVIIGVFHPLVSKGEYYFGTRIWWFFLIGGIAGLAASLSIDNEPFIWTILCPVISRRNPEPMRQLF